MIKKLGYLCFLVFMLQPVTFAQFAPPAGHEGTTAIHCDSSVFVAWATSCILERGLQQIDNPSLGYASYGEPDAALGKADGTMSVVSLGDGGNAVLTFASPICNGPGPDFAVFENSFNDGFLEFAFVEVSSDGEHFFRFPSISLTQTETQTDGFGFSDCTKVHNLAGKYMALYGTPFDLDDIEDNVLLDKQNITHVRVVDVVGNIDPEYATYDSEGNIVNDPWPTPFESSGFDLDAVGVIHDVAHLGINEIYCNKIEVFPNPCSTLLHLPFDGECRIYSLTGTLVMEQPTNNKSIDISALQKGLYFIEINSSTAKIFKQ
ncbi:MAG: T9SS type A sorting domain-containing protein [Candidatus Limimorpha sp.]